ncbi:glycosyltransferase [Ectothiorhodospiraceae bacterium BW-2]|nr:glycosyltransferase [Ectothiorhodospiraceae bacterium BW-2]
MAISKNSSFVGRYKRYPDLTGKRICEGGKRLNNYFPQSKEDKPLVTIITVCFNSAKTIEQTILSVINQTYSNIEYIVVDGGSADGTLDILRRYDEQIDYYVSEPDDGLYYAMNKGLELAKGKYILILNSDDWYVFSCVEMLINAQKNQKVDFVSGLANYADNNGRFLHLQPSFPFDAGIYFRMPLRHETMLLSAEIYDAQGPYDTRYRINADRALTTRLFEAGYTHYEVKKAVMFFRNTGVSSTQMNLLLAERSRMIARSFPSINNADVSSLANLDTLTPERLSKIVKSYKSTQFSESALALAKEKAAKGSKAWTGLDWSMYQIEPSECELRDKNNTKCLTIATFSTSDHGGAGIGSMRRIEALRNIGHKAELYCVFSKTKAPYVDQIKLSIPNYSRMKESEIRKIWRDKAVVTKGKVLTLSAREMFSDIGSIVDFRDIQFIFDKVDIVHMHWVSGMFDFDHTETLANKPVAWTLADMNAFTGGCHYSEGCKNYENDCRNCPLLGNESDLAHKAWQIKQQAYGRIKNLHIICPSQWLADCARESSLFRDRAVHMIPNALPVERFAPTNKIVARLRLGLPLRSKLVVFGAESLNNRRKGGDILANSIRYLKEMGEAANVEGVFFGASSLDLGIKSYNMGYISDEAKLSLVYASADVFAFPSREDNAPLTLVESMLSGTPAVAFSVGNVSELIDHKITGFIARYEDPKDFAEGLAWALAAVGSNEAHLRGLRCHRMAKKHNDPNTSVKRHLNLYNKMLN